MKRQSRINGRKECWRDRNVETINKDVERDFILGAEQAKDYGIVDHVISRRER